MSDNLWCIRQKIKGIVSYMSLFSENVEKELRQGSWENGEY